MTDTSLKEAIREAYASAPSSEVVLFTIEMNHPAFTQPLRVVRDNVKLEAYLGDSAPENPGEKVTFVPYAFDLTLPEMDEYGKPEITITIDNVGRDIMNYIEAAVRTRYKIDVIYRLYLASDTSGPQNDPPMVMQVNTINATPKSISLVAGFADLSNRTFPKFLYTLEQFPSLQTS